MSSRWLAVFALFLILIAIAAVGGATENATDKVLFLVARRELSDPLFKRSVVLMLPLHNTNLVVGLIVNKPTQIPLREVFPKNSAFKKRSDTAYFGGPVDTNAPSALFRSSKALKQAVHLTGDLYVSFDSHFIEGILKKPKRVLGVHLFLGRAQWAPEQLRYEALRGAWYSGREENSWIFSGDPEDVWSILIGRLEPSPVVPIGLERGGKTWLSFAGWLPDCETHEIAALCSRLRRALLF
jgi:putative transcriptional regulator